MFHFVRVKCEHFSKQKLVFHFTSTVRAFGGHKLVFQFLRVQAEHPQLRIQMQGPVPQYGPYNQPHRPQARYTGWCESLGPGCLVPDAISQDLY